MMNGLALCLVVTSLAAAGVWSPSPEKQNPGEEVIVKEGHRVIVVEYEKEGLGNTKVSILSQEAHVSHKLSEIEDRSSLSGAAEKASSAAMGVVEDVKEKFKEASSVLPNLGQGLSSSHPPPNGQSPSRGELICDAFGKCKHKITDALSKAKEKVSENAHEVSEKAHEVEEEAKDAISKAKETVSQKTHAVEEGAKETAGKAKQIVVDAPKRIGEDVAANVSKKMEQAREQVAEKAKAAEEIAEDTAERVKTDVHELKKESQKDLAEILRRGREVAYDTVTYAVSTETVGSLMHVVHLLGFATAYGMSVWVTFVSSYVLAGVLPRQQFGMVQSKIYPVYFRAMAYSVGVALLGHLLSQRKQLFSSKAEMFQGSNLVASLLMVFTNLLYLEPRATKVMFERMKTEKEEGRGRESFISRPSSTVDSLDTDDAATTTTTTSATIGTTTGVKTVPERLEQEMVKTRVVRLNERLKMLNTYSSFLNILTLMALTCHLIYLGQRLHITS